MLCQVVVSHATKMPHFGLGQHNSSSSNSSSCGGSSSGSGSSISSGSSSSSSSSSIGTNDNNMEYFPSLLFFKIFLVLSFTFPLFMQYC